jgi:hypothetical protein
LGFHKSQKGICRIKLDPLKSCSQLSGCFSIELESKRFNPTLEVKINLREPIAEKEYTVTSKTVFAITKSYPPFRGDGEGGDFEHPSTSGSSTSKTVPVQSKPQSTANVVKKPEVKVQSEPKRSVSNQPPIDASEFTQEELDDPDIQDNLNSLKVLEFKIAQLEEHMKKIEGRPPSKMREKFLKLKCRKNVLSEQLGESVSIESYLLMMKKQLDKDKKLLAYFEQNKMMEQGKKVAERIPLLVKEMDEAISFAKNKK